ncbi:MAG: hypothetical protein WCJ49_00020 [Deltaproteobacteria bacterium]
MDIYPGKAISELFVVDSTARKGLILKSEKYSETFFLHNRYGIDKKSVPGNIFFAMCSREKDPKTWVILPQDKKYECIKEIFEKLFKYGINKPYSIDYPYPWNDIWNSISLSQTRLSSIKKFSTDETKDGWSRWFAESEDGDVIPVRGWYSQNISEKHAKFFPVDISKRLSSIYHDSTFTDKSVSGINSWPISFGAKIRLENSFKQINTSLILYPSADIMKLHSNIRTHVYGAARRSFLDEEKDWKKEFGWQPELGKSNIFEDCPPNCEDCAQNERQRIYKLQENLSKDVLKYFNSVVTFLQKAATYTSRVNITIKKIDETRQLFPVHIAIKDKPKSSQATGRVLFLRGWCYNENLSCFHINLLTLYTGLDRGHKIKIDTNEHIIHTGTIFELTRKTTAGHNNDYN